MKNNLNKEKIRERILSNGYGKFDLVEDILTKEEILNLKPRIILKNITERLSLPQDKINRKTFWSWLRRYRGNNKPVNFYHGNIKPIEEFNSDPVKEAQDQEWLKNFKPSIPKVRDQMPVVIKVIRSNTNSQNTNLKIKK